MIPPMTVPASAANPAAQPAEGFIRLWGEMGTHWGVPRTMTQVHALLFIEGRALNTDDIMGRLSISRGNASMTLRTLVDWGMITRTHNPQDRKDYYAAEQDVWKLFATIARARKRREIEPLMASLKQVLDESTGNGDAASGAQRAKIEEVLAFTRLFDAVAEQFLASGPTALTNLSDRR
jgi:DNA-binding transcriptional regulator GbsR (MarR family)